MPIDDPGVIRLLAEGGCLEIHGHKGPDGSWRFVSRAMNLDGEDSARAGGIPWCKDLSEALPGSHWIRFQPVYVHPDLRGWLRDRYDAALASLPAYQREMHEYRHRKWQSLFDSTPPDRWCDEGG